MKKIAVETFLNTPDYGDDSYLFESSSSSDSDEECSCSCNNINETNENVSNSLEFNVSAMSDADFKNNFRVDRVTAEKIAELVGGAFSSNHECELQSITSSKAIQIFLWYLGNLETLKQISTRFQITISCVKDIIKLGAENLSSLLKDYVKWPSGKDYSALSKSYFQQTRICGAVGSMATAHFKILEPERHPEKFLNVRNFSSVAVQGTVTSNYKFIDVHICEGGMTSIDILTTSKLVRRADNDVLDEYFLVCNNDYPALPWLIPPFPNHNTLTYDQIYFNKCHRQAMAIVERVFGSMKNRFRRLTFLDCKDSQLLVDILKASCVLYNLCVDLNDTWENVVDGNDAPYTVGIYEENEDDVDSVVNGDDARRFDVMKECVLYRNVC